MANRLPKKKKTIQEKLEDKIAFEPTSGCWIWLGTVESRGNYGQINIGNVSKKPHRLSYLIHKGDPTGFSVLHHCDTPLCVNPDHLYLGTHKDNINDMVRRNRQASGERCHKSKLDSLQVLVIKKCISEGMNIPQIAKYFSVAPNTIRSINKGITWFHPKQHSYTI